MPARPMMGGVMDALYTAIRAACSTKPGRWGSVSPATERCASSPGRTTRSSPASGPSRPGAPKVVLFLDDPEWVCDCGSRAEACEHVAAAAIAVQARLRRRRRIRDFGRAAPGPRRVPGSGGVPGAVLRARFGPRRRVPRSGDRLGGGQRRPRRRAAVRGHARRSRGRVVLGAARRGPVPAGLAGKLLAALGGAPTSGSRTVRSAPDPSRSRRWSSSKTRARGTA